MDIIIYNLLNKYIKTNTFLYSGALAIAYLYLRYR